MKKIITIVILVAVLFPVIPMILPKPITIERIKAAFENAGLTVSDFSQGGRALEAAESWYLSIGEARVEIYRYEEYAKLVKNIEYQKDDPGSVIVEAWNLSESLGAAKNPNPPVSAVKKGKFMMVVKSFNKELRKQIVVAFGKM